MGHRVRAEQRWELSRMAQNPHGGRADVWTGRWQRLPRLVRLLLLAQTQHEGGRLLSAARMGETLAVAHGKAGRAR